MLVRFHSSCAGSVLLFDYVATELLKLMGMSGTVPGAVLAAQVPAALKRLTAAVKSEDGDRIPRPPAAAGERKRAGKDDDEVEQQTSGITLRRRAYPLIEMLQTAADEECDVVWEDAERATG